MDRKGRSRQQKSFSGRKWVLGTEQGLIHAKHVPQSFTPSLETSLSWFDTHSYEYTCLAVWLAILSCCHWAMAWDSLCQTLALLLQSVYTPCTPTAQAVSE